VASSKLRIVKTTYAHIDSLKGRLREADDMECRAWSGMSADHALERGFEDSALCWTGMKGREPFCCFGVAPFSMLSSKGIPWMLGTDDIAKCKKFVIRNSKPYIKLILTMYTELENYVDVRNEVSINWLKWCGFKFDEPKRIGVEGKPFHRFWLKGEDYV